MNETAKEKVMRETLTLIIDLAYGYDGYHKAEDLKELIDELAEIAKNGLNGLSPWRDEE